MGPITRSSSKASSAKKGPTTRSFSRGSPTKMTPKRPPKTSPTEDWVIVPDKDHVTSPIPSWSEAVSPGHLGETTSTNLSAIDSDDSNDSIHKYLAIRPFPSPSPEQSPTKDSTTKVNTSSTNMSPIRESPTKKVATEVASNKLLSSEISVSEMPATERVTCKKSAAEAAIAEATTTDLPVTQRIPNTTVAKLSVTEGAYASDSDSVDGHDTDVDGFDSYIDSDIDSDASEQKRIKASKRPKLIPEKPVAKEPTPEPTTEELEERRIRLSKVRAIVLPILMEMEGEGGVGEWLGKEVEDIEEDIEEVKEKIKNEKAKRANRAKQAAKKAKK